MNNHSAGYSILKRVISKKRKRLEITLEQYTELKERGCDNCKKKLPTRLMGVYLKNPKKDCNLNNIFTSCILCRTEKKNEEFDYLKHCIAQLRRGWNKQPPALLAKAKALQENGLYTCFHCKGEFKDKEIQIDHVESVVSVVDGFISLDQFAKRLLHKDAALNIVCKPCHKVKTKAEQKLRKEHGSILKSKINKKKENRPN